MSKFIDIMADCFFTEYEENIAYDKAEKAIAEHDKQICEEVIEKFLKELEYRFFDDGLWECVTKEDIYEIAEKLKGEQDE